MTDDPKGAGELHLAPWASAALLQVILQSLMRHPTFSRTHLTPERCQLTGRAEAAAKLFSANADSQKATKNNQFTHSDVRREETTAPLGTALPSTQREEATVPIRIALPPN